MALYTVKAQVVKVSIGGTSGHRVAHIARKGDVLPEGVNDAQIESLLKRGRIEKVAEAEEPEGAPSSDWTAAQLKAYADAHGVDVASAKNKGEMVEAIAAATAGDGSDKTPA